MGFTETLAYWLFYVAAHHPAELSVACFVAVLVAGEIRRGMATRKARGLHSLHAVASSALLAADETNTTAATVIGVEPSGVATSLDAFVPPVPGNPDPFPVLWIGVERIGVHTDERTWTTVVVAIWTTYLEPKLGELTRWLLGWLARAAYLFEPGPGERAPSTSDNH